MSPGISVVTATYNRSRVLACAIESVRRQSFEDWELIVVGDSCTDDTAEVVAKFSDSRIRFINLERNIGEQAGPNNVGLAEAAAPLVAYLNHDDIWLPNHLTLCHQALQAEQADLVYSAAVSIGADSPQPLQFDTLRLALIGLGEGYRYAPWEMEHAVAPASCWLARRAVLIKLGGWRLARDAPVEPSQDLLFRAWRAGYRLRALNLVTLVIVASGFRPGSYLETGAPEQEWVLDRIDDPQFPIELAAMALETNSTFNRRSGPRAPRAWRLAARAAAHAGLNPRLVQFRFRHRVRADGYVRRLRAQRGVPVFAPPPGAGPALRYEMVQRAGPVYLPASIDFTPGAGGARFLLSGWSRPDPGGVWNDGKTAEVLFKLGAPPDGDLVAEVELRPFLGRGGTGRTVQVWVSDEPLETWTLGPVDGWYRRLVIPHRFAVRQYVVLRFRFDNPESPAALGLSDDPRMLAMSLVRARLSDSGDQTATDPR